jgi:hypothetical protein
MLQFMLMGEGKVTIVILTMIGLLLAIPMTGKTMAQSGFTDYDNKYFTMVYPSGWTVNDTGFSDLDLCCNPYHHLINAPGNDARISLEVYGPVLHAPLPCCVTLNKNYWLNKLSYGDIISIDNQTQYMSGKQALVANLVAHNNDNKQMIVGYDT